MTPKVGTILLSGGNHVVLSDVESCMYTIEEIAHALAHICRFGGHCSRHYSVAQHSVLVSRLVPPQDAFEGLMHDAAEALTGDLPRPLKKLLPDFQVLEQQVEVAVCRRFGVRYPFPASVKDADALMLATEQHALMPERFGRSYAEGKTPLALALDVLTPEQAKRQFLDRYDELIGMS